MPAADSLSDITALSATDVRAGGTTTDATGNPVPLTLRFSGTGFATVASPSPRSSAAYGPGLEAADAAGPRTIIATGIGAAGPFGEETNQG